jgi:hypothetical protein
MKSRSDSPVIAEYRDKPRSSANFRFHVKHGKLMPEGLRVGKKGRVRLSGKVTGLRSDEYGHSMDMDIEDMCCDEDQDEKEFTSLTKAMRKRNSRRHMGSGRFV